LSQQKWPIRAGLLAISVCSALNGWRENPDGELLSSPAATTGDPSAQQRSGRSALASDEAVSQTVSDTVSQTVSDTVSQTVCDTVCGTVEPRPPNPEPLGGAGRCQTGPSSFVRD